MSAEAGAPSYTRCDLTDVAAIVQRQLIKQCLLREHIADLSRFSASDASAMITKQCFVVDAGLR